MNRNQFPFLSYWTVSNSIISKVHNLQLTGYFLQGDKATTKISLVVITSHTHKASPSSCSDGNNMANDWLLGSLLYLRYFTYFQMTITAIVLTTPSTIMTIKNAGESLWIIVLSVGAFFCWHTLTALWVKLHCLLFGMFCSTHSVTRSSWSSWQQAEHGLHSVPFAI